MRVYFPEQRLVLKPRTIHATTHTTTFMNEGPHRFFGIRDSPYFKVGIRDFKSILGARFEIERMHGMRNAELRDWGKIWVGMTGLKNPIRDPHESPAEKNYSDRETRASKVALEHRKTLRGYMLPLEAVWQFKERQCNSNKNAKTRGND